MRPFAFALLVLAMPLLFAHAEGRPPQGPVVLQFPSLTQDAAEKMVAAAKAKAAALDSDVYKGAKCKMHIYVLGHEGTLLASTQADGAWPGSADIALRKARTSWCFKLPSGVIGELSRLDHTDKGAPLYGIEISNTGLITFPGGLPIFDGNVLAGAIGVSGDSVGKDLEVAQAGVDKATELGKNALASVPALSTAGAAVALHAALKKAAETESGVYAPANTKMHVYVLGRNGTVLAAGQSDDAWPGSADIAQRKARTSWLFNLPTGVIGDLSRTDKPAKAPLYGIELSNTGLISFPGGVPIQNEKGELVGSVGVSGDTVGKDHEVAQAGVDAVKALLKK